MTFMHLSEITPEVIAYLPAPTVFRGYITGVGSRETPEDVQRTIRLLAAVLLSLGYVIRSGGALGADEAFELGVKSHPHYRKCYYPEAPMMEIYLPWNGFEAIPQSGIKKWEDVAAGYYNAKKLPLYEQAQQIALRHHVAPEAIQKKQGMFALHTRNVFQVLGLGLNEPSKRLYCWAPPGKDELVTGGTRTAVSLAKHHKVPWVNLALPDSHNLVILFLLKYFNQLMDSKHVPVSTQVVAVAQEGGQG